MIVGLVTFHYAHNYGAVLQAYAIKKTVEKIGAECRVVDYRNSAIVEHYPENISNIYGKRELFLPWNWRHTVRKMWYSKKRKNAWNIQWKSFEKFIKNVILEEKEYTTQDFYDVLVCGSDQIWGGKKGPTTYLDDNYFLKFNKTAKKIAYAPSSKEGRILKEERDYFKTALRDFTVVTAREKDFAQDISRVIGSYVETVIDPVFLLKQEDYLKLLKNEKNFPESDQGYVLAYFLDEDDRVREVAAEVACILGKRVLELHYYLQTDYPISNQVADAGPEDFISLVKNAEYIVTNSFHGVAFSVIFKKMFWAVYDKDSRKDNLLSLLQLQNRHICDKGAVRDNSAIDYENTFYIIECERNKSIELLKREIV